MFYWGITMKISATLLAIASTALLAGCGSVMPFSSPAYNDRAAMAAPAPARITKLSAVGYGATSSFDGYTAGQKRLMAMRASKLDAYRSLAEQVYGVRVSGTSTVAALMAQNDSFRVYVDAFIRGAKVLSVTPMADGNYETILELAFDESSMRSFAAPPANTTTASNNNANSSGCKGANGQDCGYSSSFYYSD
jgi:hypothetical protein